MFLATPLSAADGQLAFVPWKVLEPGAQPAHKAFVLFWIPASPDDMRRSALITSHRLALYATRCIGMHVVRADDQAMLSKLNAAAQLPLAILFEGDKEVARIRPASGGLSVDAVEAMVRDAFDSREASLDGMIDDAAKKAATGDNSGAVAIYRMIAAQQCAFPRLAKTAQRALRRLGVKVE